MHLTSTLKKINLRYLQFCLEAHIKAMQSANKQEWLVYHFEQATKLKEKIKRHTTTMQQEANIKAVENILTDYKAVLLKQPQSKLLF